MSSSTLTPVLHDGGMDPSQPRSGGPTRRSFTPAQKLEHLASYEAAAASGTGGAYLRQQGLYSSQITEWRKLRDAGVLSGKSAGARVGRPSAEQSEIARRRQLDVAQRRLSRTEAALDIMGKAHAPPASRSSPDMPPKTTGAAVYGSCAAPCPRSRRPGTGTLSTTTTAALATLWLSGFHSVDTGNPPASLSRTSTPDTPPPRESGAGTR